MSSILIEFFSPDVRVNLSSCADQNGSETQLFDPNMEFTPSNLSDTNSSDAFNESILDEEEKQLQFKLNSSFGAWLVFMEMSLALVGIVLNLTVVISIREKESLLNNTVNIILGNLCFSNLIAAVLGKSIAVVYHGYAMARSRWEVELAFCTLHTITSRVTWAVFPYTLLVLCWHGLALRLGKIIKHMQEAKSLSNEEEATQSYLLGGTAIGCDLSSVAKLDKQSSTETPKETTEETGNSKPEAQEEEEEYAEGLTSNQKCALGFIWFVSAVYSILSQQILSKERDIHCSLRSELSDNFNFISLFIAIAVPFILGPVFCPIGHILLSCVTCCKNIKSAGCCAANNALSDCGLVTAFTIVFVTIYPVQMYVTEEYMANGESMFVYMAFKYCYGCLHLVFLPFIILIVKKDIRHAAVSTYVKTNVEDSGEITYEEFQKNTGIGVNPVV